MADNTNPRRPRIAMIVANPVTVDIRVKKAAASMVSAGFDVRVFALAQGAGREEVHIGGATVVRIPTPHRVRRAAKPPKAPRSERVAELHRYNRARRLLHEQDGAYHLAKLEEQAGSSAADRARLEAQKAWWRVRHEAVKMPERLTYRLQNVGNGERAKARSRYRGWRHEFPEFQDYELAFAGEIDAYAPDIIHAHDVHMLAIAARAKARLRRRGLQTALLYDSHEYIQGLATWKGNKLQGLIDLEAEFIRDADAIVTVSRPISQRLQRDYGVAVFGEVMNAPVLDPSTHGLEVPSLRQDGGVPHGVRLLAYSGGLDATRGVDTMCAGLEFLPDDVHAVLIIKRVNSLVVDMLQRGKQAGYAHRIHTTDFVDPAILPQYLAEADVGVHPLARAGDNHEVALPNKLFDYIHAGLPVVVSDCEAMDELVNRLGVGVSFVAGDPQSFATATMKVLDDLATFADRVDDPDLLRKFSWGTQARVLLDAYRSILPAGCADAIGEPADSLDLVERPVNDA